MTTDLVPRWRVRPGRECRVCGWALLADMVRHRRKPDGHDRICRPCAAADARARRAADPDRYREADRARRAADPEQRRRNNRASYLRHRERRCKEVAEGTAARVRRNKARTPEQIEEDARRVRPTGEKVCRACRVSLPLAAFALARRNTDGRQRTCRECDAHGRLLRLAAPRWAEDDEYACVYCGAPFEHVDHVWPVADGGPDDPHNLVPACASCNLSKNARHVLEFVAERLGEEVVAEVLTWPVRVVDLGEELLAARRYSGA